MTIKESLIKTNYFRGIESFEIPVFITDEFLDTSVYEFAHSAVHGGYLPYLFVGYFKGKDQKFGKWYFSNAQRHEEMKEAVIKEIGEAEYVYGQIYFDEKKLSNGILVFNSLLLRDDVSNNESERIEIIKDLFNNIKEENLKDHTSVSNTGSNYWLYVREKHNKNLMKFS